MFPFTMTGNIKFTKTSQSKIHEDEFLQNLLYDSLKNQIPMSIKIKNNTIIFRRFIFNTLNNWNVLFLFDSGKFKFENTYTDTIMTYSLSTKQGAFFQLIFVLFVLLAGFFPPESRPSPDNRSGVSIYYAIPFISFIYIVNYLITKIRFRKWLRDLLPA